jgi:exodeoxyribonuclease-3
MKVASFNVNSIRVRLSIILDWLRKESPDVLCLQETKCRDDMFPREAFETVHYHAAFRGEKSYNGVAILTRLPFSDVQIGFDASESSGTRLIKASVGKIPVVNTYVPQGFSPHSRQFREKLDWLQRLLDYFKQNFQPDQPLLWVGDFNVAPEAIDVYDPESLLGQAGFHPDEHAALQRLKEWGFVDVFRMHQAAPELYTFWDYRLKNALARRVGWRVDHIWATKPLAKKSLKAWIDVAPRMQERPSDHTLIVAEFKV